MLVTLSQAKKLKELGYREKVIAYYVDGSIDFNSPINWNTNEGLDEDDEPQDDDGYYSAPTVSEALDWLREEKGVHSGVIPLFRLEKVQYGYRYFGMKEGKPINRKESYLFDSHPLAESALLDEVMKYVENGNC